MNCRQTSFEEKRFVRTLLMLLGMGFWLAGALPAAGQFQQEADLGDATVQKWQIGMIITATGTCRAISGNVAVPDQWPEQSVEIVDEQIPPGVDVKYETMAGTLKQMIIKITEMEAGEQAKVLVTFAVRRSMQLPPNNPAQFVLPDARTLDRTMREYLKPSPYIESTNPKIKALARQIGADAPTAWQRVEAIYDWVRANVEYQDVPLKGALKALEDGTGDCDELSSLFIAICRAAGVPARTVRVPNHCYPEFYLVDANGGGRWFPCQAAGDRAFGGMPDPRPILQKGDNIPFRDLGSRRLSRERFLPETLVGVPLVRGQIPRVQIICEQVEEQTP